MQTKGFTGAGAPPFAICAMRYWRNTIAVQPLNEKQREQMKSFIPKCLFGLSLALSVNIAHAACPSVPFHSNNNIEAVVNAHGGWPLTEAQCDLLNRNNVAINVIGSANVVDGVSIGWAVISLIDEKTNITSDASHYSFRINKRDAGDNVASNLLYKAIEIDLAHFDWDKAVRQINHFRANARR
jgi:hypothetical protein